MGIPAIVALHHSRSMIREDELIVIDGTQGVVIVNPDKHVLTEYRLKQNEARIEREKLKRLRSAPAATLDGTLVHLHANIELPGDIESVRSSGATGVGLFRSEFLFMNRRDLPDEDEQFESYREVVEGMKGMPVTLRTLDIGADKSFDGEEHKAVNPALGLRAIRYCLAEPQVFNTQLRAILRASAYGKVMILIPMLSSWAEVTQSLLAVAAAKEQLRDQRVKFDEYVPVGGMIEVPAAAISLPMFIRKLDFISIGTNDLIQYTLAIDRTDDAVAHLYDPLHPAILSLISSRDPHGAPAREARGGLRRDGGRRGPHAPAAGLRAAPLLDAPGARAHREAARAQHEPPGHHLDRRADPAHRRAREAAGADREAERLKK